MCWVELHAIFVQLHKLVLFPTRVSLKNVKRSVNVKQITKGQFSQKFRHVCATAVFTRVAARSCTLYFYGLFSLPTLFIRFLYVLPRTCYKRHILIVFVRLACRLWSRLSRRRACCRIKPVQIFLWSALLCTLLVPRVLNVQTSDRRITTLDKP